MTNFHVIIVLTFLQIVYFLFSYFLKSESNVILPLSKAFNLCMSERHHDILYARLHY